MLRILAFSDIHRWDDQAALVAEHRPDVVTLAGDLTSDGTAAFWRSAFEAIPAYRDEKERALKAHGITVTSHEGFEVVRGGSLLDLMDIEHEIKSRFQDTPAFHTARRTLHTELFYGFLRRVGRLARVLVVRGDHDDDFAGDYDPDRINRIRGCREISGQRTAVKGVSFLGLGFRDCERRTTLRRFACDGSCDVVVCHARQRVLRDVAAVGGRLILRGHFGFGAYLVDGIPAVFTSGGYALVQLPKRGAPRIAPSREIEPFLVDRYPWLAPYPSRPTTKAGLTARLPNERCS